MVRRHRDFRGTNQVTSFFVRRFIDRISKIQVTVSFLIISWVDVWLLKAIWNAGAKQLWIIKVLDDKAENITGTI